MQWYVEHETQSRVRGGQVSFACLCLVIALRCFPAWPAHKVKTRSACAINKALVYYQLVRFYLYKPTYFRRATASYFSHKRAPNASMDRRMATFCPEAIKINCVFEVTPPAFTRGHA